MKRLVFILLLSFVTSLTFAQNIPDWTKVSTDGDTINLHSKLAVPSAVIISFFDLACGAPCLNAHIAMFVIWTEKDTGDCDIWVYGIDVNANDNDSAINAYRSDYGLTFPFIKDGGAIFSHYDSLYGNGQVPMYVLIIGNDTNPATSLVTLSDTGWSAWMEQDIKDEYLNYGYGIGCPQGINESSNHNYFQLHPNPTTGVFTITGQGPVQVFDLLGRQIASPPKADRNDGIEVDLSGYRPGVYLVKVGNSTTKLILTK